LRRPIEGPEAACDLFEEYIGAKVFPVHVGWSIATWNDFASAIKIPDFTRSFRLEKNGIHLSFLLSFIFF
jgi:hypothetical protein